MKNIIALLATLLCVGYSQAANVEKLKPSDFYQSKEVSVSTFGVAKIDNLKDFRRIDGPDYGGGVGLNYYHWKTAGVGLEAQSYNLTGDAIDQLGGKLIGRLPFDRLSINYGIGGQFEFGPDRWSVFAEVGPELRLTKHIGLFALARGVRPIGYPQGEHILGLVGVSIR